jgi:hypothetical protein
MTALTSNAVSQMVDEAVLIRGRIVSSYAHVEFLLADISVKLDLRFPYPIKERIKAVKDIAGRNGYEAYKKDLDRTCDELLRYDDLRHFMAHGFLTLTIDMEGNHELEYRRYQREGDGKFALVIFKTTLERLRQAVGEITKYVSDAVMLFKKIYREQKLEG